MDSFEVSVSAEQRERIKNRYEYLRKTEQYRSPRVKKAFQPKELYVDLEQKAREKITVEDHLRLEMSINFPLSDDGEAKWREYGGNVQRVFAALAKKTIQPDIDMHLTRMGGVLGYGISSEFMVGEGGKEEAIRKVLWTLRHLLFPDSTKYADEPIHVSLAGRGTHVLDPESFRLSFYLDKSPCQDFIGLNDVPLVFSYYRQIADFVLADIAHRGLTVYAAVDMKDGESIIRRNNVGGKRLVIDDVDEIGRLIMDYDAFRFVPDCNLFGSDLITRIPIDLDKPSTISWKDYAEFVNGFKVWLEDEGFKPRLRLTGGRGVQIILNISIDRLAKNYSNPFPKPIKFDTWWDRFGPAGLISYQAVDLVKVLALAYGSHRKSKHGKSVPLTIEMHDSTQRYWNIFADSSRAVRDMGVVGLGSIHHKTGAVSMPLETLPETFSLESVLEVSYSPNVEPSELEPKYRSPWIQTVGKNPLLLLEPSQSSRDNPFSLVEEAFEKFGSLPVEYVKIGSERFMEKYCWS